MVGPAKQLANMVDSKRRIVSLVFIGSMIMTFVCVFMIQSKILTLIFIIAQFCSYIWYVLSYIPYGREMCGGCLKNIIGVDPSAMSVSTTAV